MCGFGEADHRSFHVLFSYVALTFAQEVDDSLVRFQVFIPDGSSLSTRSHSQANERKKWRQDSDGVFQKVWVPGDPA